jgi:hypothetical protein
MFRRRCKPSSPTGGAPSDTYVELRALALRAESTSVVVDIPVDDGYATLVAMRDDTTSLYLSTGGGTIGAGSHARVAAAAGALRAALVDNLTSFSAGERPDLPPRTAVRFHVSTGAGRYTADVPTGAFWGEVDDPLTPVIATAQDLITAVSSV